MKYIIKLIIGSDIVNSPEMPSLATCQGAKIRVEYGVSCLCAGQLELEFD